MPFARAVDVDHPLLADFVALNDPEQRRQIERRGDHFVVEGILALDRLLELGTWDVRAVAVSPKAADRLADALAPLADRVVVADPSVLEAVVGFDIHRGVLASVQRRPPITAADLVGGPRRTFVALEGVNDHENLGAIYRNAAAFGVGGVLLDPSCADPFYRRSVRVSLGHVLAVPTAQLGVVPAGIEELRTLGATVVGLVARGGRPLRALTSAPDRPGPTLVLAGAEGPGLTDGAISACDELATIEMAAGVDSLNVATALAIALHHLAPAS